MPSSVRVLVYYLFFICNMSTVNKEDGKQNYVELVKLLQAICTLSHENATRFFNKHLLTVNGGSTREKTIQTVRFVKDFIDLNGGKKNIKVLKPMLTECLLSC